VGGEQQFGDGFDDLFMHLVDAQVAADQDDAVGFAGGDCAVLFPYTADAGVLFLLNSALVLAGICGVSVVEAAGAVEAGGERWQ
jgi:hypothetical protein